MGQDGGVTTALAGGSGGGGAMLGRTMSAGMRAGHDMYPRNDGSKAVAMLLGR
jgi:hypothetical protein